MKETISFVVTVPARGTDGKKLPVRVVREYIADAVRDWSGQFNPDEDNMFYWCSGRKTKVTRARRGF